MSDFGKILIERLKHLLDDLKSGEPIGVTEVQRIDTPDGPMHIRKKVIYHERNIDRDTES
jgi:hypothetical protein